MALSDPDARPVPEEHQLSPELVPEVEHHLVSLAQSWAPTFVSAVSTVVVLLVP